MKYRIHNDDSTDFCDYEADTIEGIREACASRIKMNGWRNGWSEKLDG